MDSNLKLSYQLIPNSGETILFLHGFLSSSHQWEPIVNYYKVSNQILLIDLPAHGDSPESNPYSIDDVSHAINAILQESHIKKIHFVGHSMGGYVGCAFARAYPEKTKSLTLINSCASADSKERRLQRDRSLIAMDKFPAAFVSMAVSNLFSTAEKAFHAPLITKFKSEASRIPVNAIKNAIVAMRDRPSYIMELAKNQTPVSYVYGKNDQIIPPDLIDQELELLQNSRSILLDSGHMSLLTNPEDILKNMHFIE